jgi:hypothetical protein
MTKFKVHLTRLVEEECCIYVDAATHNQAVEVALETASEVADLVWDRSNAEPHTVSVETCAPFRINVVPESIAGVIRLQRAELCGDAGPANRRRILRLELEGQHQPLVLALHAHCRH